MPNPYKYGTPEYKIFESIENLNISLQEISKWRQDIGVISQVESINSCGKLYSDFQSYYNNSHSYYRPSFDKLKREHIEEAAQNAKKEAEVARLNAEEIHKKNIPAIENNIKLVSKIKNIFKNLGISETYSTWDYKTSRSSSKTETTHTAGYIEDLKRNIKTSDGYETNLASLKNYEARIDKWLSDNLKEIAKIEQEKVKSDKELRKLALAVELAKKYQISYSTNEELFKSIEEIERENFRNKEYPDGKEVDISCCQECSSWTVGNHRCSCGNRRMYLDIEGNFMDGYYGNPMAD
jgi:hypothetical protein